MVEDIWKGISWVYKQEKIYNLLFYYDILFFYYDILE